jgi:hypothetical protein
MHDPNVVRHWLESLCPVFIEIAAALGDVCDVWRHDVDEPQDAHAVSLLRTSCCRHRYVMVNTRIGNYQQSPIMADPKCHGAEKEGGSVRWLGNDNATRNVQAMYAYHFFAEPSSGQHMQAMSRSHRSFGWSSHIKCRLLLLWRSMTSH